MSAEEQVAELASYIQANFDGEITDGGAVENAMRLMEHWRNVAFDLWRLLDNIDTMDDICKDDDASCRKMVNRESQKRHAILLVEGEYLGKKYGDHLKKAYK